MRIITVSKQMLSKLCCLFTVATFFNAIFIASLSFAATPVTIDQAIQDDLYPSNTNKLSFYFQNIELRTLLQLIAKSSKLNFIISDKVKGNVTLNLKDVTWQQALNIVLKTNGLTSRRVGNVIYVSTFEEITTNEAQELKAVEAIANLAPLKSRVIRLKYTIAKDVAALLKGQAGSLLTGRGDVAFDERTNTLIIRDTELSLTEIVHAIQRLDIPARQVLIEARIVNVDTTFEEQLGVRFGISNSRNLSGTLEGANQIRQTLDPTLVTPLTKRLNFNIPATEIFGNTPGSIGLALAKVGKVLLDLELSALEGERHAQVISRPRVITSNQQKAVIQTGEEIPYQEATSSGATSVVFKKAVLSLEIIPQITPDNKIVLKIKATQDTRGENTAVGAIGGVPLNVPAINTQAVESMVLLENNETIAVGGVYRVVKQNNVDRIPFFGTLPLVGRLFTHEGIHNERHELLIFLTPKIVNGSHDLLKTAYK